MIKLIGYATVIGLGLYFGLIQLALALVGALLVWAGSMLMVFGGQYEVDADSGSAEYATRVQ